MLDPFPGALLALVLLGVLEEGFVVLLVGILEELDVRCTERDGVFGTAMVTSAGLTSLIGVAGTGNAVSVVMCFREDTGVIEEVGDGVAE